VFAAELELTFGEQQRPLWTGTSCEVSFFPAQRVPASIEFAEGMLAAGPQGKPGISIGVQTLAPIAVEPGATFALLARGRQIGRGTVRVIPAAQPGQGKTTRKERALALSGVPGWRVLRRVAARAGSDVFVVGDLARRAISRIRDPLGFESIDPADFVPFATPVQLAYSGPPQARQSLRTALHQDVPFAELFEWTLDEARRIPGFSPVPSLRLGLPLRATQPLLDPASAETDVLSGVYRFEGSIGTGGSAFSRLHATLRYALTLIDAPRFTKSAPSESDLAHVREFTAQINERELVDVLGTVDTAQRLHRVIVKCWVYSRSTREFIDLLERVGAFGLLQRVCARVEPSIPLPIEARASLVSTPLTRSERPRLPYDTDRWSSAVAAEGDLTRTLRAAGQRLAGGQRVLWMSPDLPIASSPLEHPVRESELGEFVHIAFAAALDESPVDVLEDAGLAAILLTLPTASDGGWNWQAHPIPSTVSRRLRVLDDGRNGWTWTARCNCLGWLKLSSSARFAIVAERAASTDERRGADA